MTLSFTDFQGIASVFIKHVFVSLMLNELILSNATVKMLQLLADHVTVCVQSYCAVKVSHLSSVHCQDAPSFGRSRHCVCVHVYTIILCCQGVAPFVSKLSRCSIFRQNMSPCVCVCGGLTGEVWAHTLVQIPGQDGNFCTKSTSSPSAHPSVKRVPGLVLGSKAHWLCLIIH